MAKHMVLRIK